MKSDTGQIPCLSTKHTIILLVTAMYPSICPLYPHHCWFGLSPHELPIAADHYPHSTLPQPGLACDICRGSVSSSAVTGNRCRENPNHRWSRMGGSLLGPFFVGFKTHGNQRLAENLLCQDCGNYLSFKKPIRTSYFAQLCMRAHLPCCHTVGPVQQCWKFSSQHERWCAACSKWGQTCTAGTAETSSNLGRAIPIIHPKSLLVVVVGGGWLLLLLLLLMCCCC